MFRNVWFPIVGSVHVGVEPVCMVSRGISAPPALQQDVGPTWCLPYGHFCHTHVHGGGIPVGIIWAIMSRQLGVFLIPTLKSMSIMKFSSCCRESHWRIFLWIFISRFCRSLRILLHSFQYHRVDLLRLKGTAQVVQLYWRISCKHSHGFLGVAASARRLHCQFYYSGLFFCFHCHIPDQKEPMFSLVIGFSWHPWGGVFPFWYQELSTGGTQVVQDVCRNVQWEFRRLETSFCGSVGVVPPKYVSFKVVLTISNGTSLT